MVLIRRLYNRTLRKVVLRVLPRKIASFGGVPVRWQALTDLTDHYDYKPVMRSLIHQTVGPGYRVIDIAAGRGVFSTIAARYGARVTAYEGASNMIDIAEETLRLNHVENRVEIVHAIVSNSVELFGPSEGAEIIGPDELPNADLLILDCEGAEEEIVRGLSAKIDNIVLESHPEHGVDTATARRALESSGFEIREQHLQDEETGKHVILAVSEDPTA